MEKSEQAKERLELRKQKNTLKMLLKEKDERKRLQPTNRKIIFNKPPPIDLEKEKEAELQRMEDEAQADLMWKEHWDEIDSLNKINEEEMRKQEEKLQNIRNNIEKTKQLLLKHKYKEPTKVKLNRINRLKEEQRIIEKEEKLMKDNEEIEKEVEKERKEIGEENEYIWEMEIMKKMEKGTNHLIFRTGNEEQKKQEKYFIMKRNILNYLKKMEDIIPTYRQQIEIKTCKEYLENPDAWDAKHEYDITYYYEDDVKEKKEDDKKPTLHLGQQKSKPKPEYETVNGVPGIRAGFIDSFKPFDRNIKWTDQEKPDDLISNPDDINETDGMVFGADERKNRNKKKPNYDDVDIVYSTVGPTQQKEKTKK